jgi:hypothetical protein
VNYSWEMVLNVSLDTSFNNMHKWKGIWERAGEVKSMKVYTSTDGLPREFSTGFK